MGKYGDFLNFMLLTSSTRFQMGVGVMPSACICLPPKHCSVPEFLLNIFAAVPIDSKDDI